MKIGEFAKKYDLTTAAVRYYVERALLTPERKNNQYFFDESCDRDMEKILKYKGYRFSLEEIELIFFLEKTSKMKDETVLDIIAEMFEQRKTDLEEEDRTILQIIKQLDGEIEEFHSIDRVENGRESAGVPLRFIPYLYCPHCGIPLDLSDVNISGNMLQSGKLSCSCGYSGSIENGIIVCEGSTDLTPFKAFENIDTLQTITDDYGSEHRQILDQAYLWMYHQMPIGIDRPADRAAGAVVLAGPFTFNFLLRHCDKFEDDTILVVIDPSRKKLRRLSDMMSGHGFKTVFIAGTTDNIPLRKESVDIYIDDYSMVNCIFTYNESRFDRIALLMKKGSVSIGVFNDYSDAPQSLKNFRKDHPDFDPDKMSAAKFKAALTGQSMKITETRVIGMTSGNAMEFPRQVGNERISVIGYRAEKQ